MQGTKTPVCRLQCHNIKDVNFVPNLEEKKLDFVSPLAEREPGGEKRGHKKKKINREKKERGWDISHTLAGVEENNKVAKTEIEAASEAQSAG